jgi:hypothetical protein
MLIRIARSVASTVGEVVFKNKFHHGAQMNDN